MTINKNKSHHGWTKAYLILVSLLDFIGLGVVVTLFPKLLLDPSLDILPAHCSMHVRLIALGCFLAIYPLGQFFGAVVFGKLSDTHGRKRMMLITLAGTIVGFALSGTSILLANGVLLFLGRLLSGIFAGNTAIAQASIIDISTPETKAKNISILQITLGFAWVIGPPMGGWLSQKSLVSWFGYSTPFWVVMGLLVLMLVLGAIFYQDTRQKSDTRTKVNAFENLINIHSAFMEKKLRMAFLIWAVFVSGWWLFEAYLPTYLQLQWHYNPAIIGTFLGCMGATYAATQLLVLRWISRANPHTLVRSSLIISGLSVAAYAIIHTGWLLIMVTACFVISMAFALPSLITSVSNLGDDENQGHLMGMISSIQALSTVAMMLLGGFLVAMSYKIPLIAGGTLLILAWGLFNMKFCRKNPIS